MPITQIIHMSRKQYIAVTLRNEIAAGIWKSGDCLPPIKVLAERFGTSIAPVHQALVALENEGLVKRRVGAGTFVTSCRPVANPAKTALFINTTGHLFGDLAHLLLDHLHHRSIYPVAVEGGHENATPIIRAAAEAANLLIVHGNMHFRFSALEGISLKNKHIIGLLDWESSSLLDQVHRVLVDHAAGGRLLAEHLLAAGHRRVLVLGTATMVNETEGRPCNVAGVGFEALWREHGGTIRVLASHGREGLPDPVIDPASFLAIMRGPDAPTAIVGLRDFEAWQAQDILVKVAPELYAAVTITGYGNTPWSQAARPPLSTVDWNIRAVAEATCRRIDAIFDGNELGAPGVEMIPPIFINRSASGEPGSIA